MLLHILKCELNINRKKIKNKKFLRGIFKLSDYKHSSDLIEKYVISKDLKVI